jgi:hypothetical protein
VQEPETVLGPGSVRALVPVRAPELVLVLVLVLAESGPRPT